MPNEVIDQVHRMARQEHGNNGLLFEDRNHNPLVNPDDDGKDDSTYHPEEDEGNDDDNNGDDDDDGADPPNNPDVEQPIYNNPSGNHEANVDQDEDDEEAEPENNEDEDNEELPSNEKNEDDSTSNEEEQMPNDHDDEEVPVNNNNGIPMAPNDPTLPPRVRRELNRLANDGVGPTIYQGWTRSQTRQPEHNMTTTEQLESSTPLPYQHMTEFEKELFHRQIAGVRVPSEIGYKQNEALRHTVLTQYTLKKGLQVFGPPGVEAVYKELQQLHEHKVGEPRDASTLSPSQKKNALGFLMFLKQKPTGQIKGQGCADGHKQRLHTPRTMQVLLQLPLSQCSSVA